MKDAAEELLPSVGKAEVDAGQVYMCVGPNGSCVVEAYDSEVAEVVDGALASPPSPPFDVIAVVVVVVVVDEVT